MFFHSIRHDPFEKYAKEGGWQKTSLPYSDCCSKPFFYAAIWTTFVAWSLTAARWCKVDLQWYCTSAWWPKRLHAILCQRPFWNQWCHSTGSANVGSSFSHRILRLKIFSVALLPVSQFILPPGQVAPRGASQPWLACPPGGNLSRVILPPTLVTFTPGGQHIPAGLSCPPGVKLNQPGYLAPHPWTWSSNCPEILELLLISQAFVNGIFHIIQIRLLVVTSTNFLKILHS